MGYNTKLTVIAGLSNDYNGTFRLNGGENGAYKNVKIDIITNGAEYVENTDAAFVHAGTSPYKEFEGILPKCTNQAVWDKYGQVFKTKLSRYTDIMNPVQEDQTEESNNESETTSDIVYGYSEIYDVQSAYEDYNNQFNVKFDGESTLIELDGEGKSPYKDYIYINYKQEQESFIGKTIQTFTLGDLGSGLLIDTTIVHFSKYYNVYSMSSGKQRLVRPLLYNQEDLNKYNIDIEEVTVDEKTYNIPYIKNMLVYRWYRYHGGAHVYESRNAWNIAYQTTSHVYDFDPQYRTEYDGEDEDDDEPSFSQFITNPKNEKTYESFGNWIGCQEGFSVFALHAFPTYESMGIFETGLQYGILPNNADWDQASSSLPQIYKSMYDTTTDTSVVSTHDVTDACIRENHSGSVIVGFIYRHDSAGNSRIFNSYFPVEIDNEYKIGQKIKYTENASKISGRPEYLGQIVASILANLYIYTDEEVGSTNYISDIVFLNDNSTLYTKDIVYRVYTEKEENKQNGLILFHDSNYETYLAQVGKFAKKPGEDPDGKFNYNNVNVSLQECVKNVPLQYKLNYIQPNLEKVGVNSNILLTKINGETKSISYDGLKVDELYQIDESGEFGRLSENFIIRWIKEIKMDDSTGRIKGTFDKIPSTKNAFLRKMFTAKNNLLDFNTVTVPSSSPKDYYKIMSRYANYYNTDYFDLPVNDILVPSARII